MGNLPPSVLRPPPPPPPPPPRHRHLPMAGLKEGNTELSSRCYYHRRCKRRRLTTMDSLPDDLLFEILLRLPAENIYRGARLVCRKWYLMIHTLDFIHSHLEHTTYGIYFQSDSSSTHFYAVLRQGRIEKSTFFNFRCPVKVSCNGLVLGYQEREPLSLYIVNPITKQHFSLPPFHPRIRFRNMCGIGYVAASMEYKVVIVTRPIENSQVYQFDILTVGVDESWRNLGTACLSTTTTEALQSRPLITEGFMHWTTNGTRVLSLHLEKEVITETPAPIHGGRESTYYMSTGSYLSLLIVSGKFLLQVWEMKPASGEWTKLPSIDLEAQKCTLEGFSDKHGVKLVPIGWLKYLEVLVFGISKHLFFYNLVTQDIESKEAYYHCQAYNFVFHRNSLVWLGG